MIRVCVFQPFGERRGGSDNLLLTLMEHLDRERFDPLVVCFGEGDLLAELARQRVRAVSLPAGRLRNPAHVIASARRVRKLLESEDPDLIVNWLSTSHVYAGLGARLAGRSEHCIWFQQDLFAERSPDRARLMDRVSALRGRALDQVATSIPAAAIGCCSEAVRIAQQGLRPQRPTFTVHPGIDPPAELTGAERQNLRERLGIPPGATVVGTVGRLFAWKGHHLLLAALARISETDPDVRGLIVGGGGHRADQGYEAFLTRLVRDHGLEGRVIFTGQVPDATSYLQVMDVFVSASSPEPFGLVLVEALALGIPAVAVNRGGPTEILEDGASGILAPSNDPEDLRAAISRLIDHPELRTSIAERGRARYRGRFTGERSTREMERRFEEYAR